MTLTDEQIRERDGFKCSRCGGTKGGLHIHHRMPRSGGLNESAANRVAVCSNCHRWCHAHPKQATEEGWIVLRSADPAEVTVQHVLWPAGPIFLLDDGGIRIWIQPDATVI